MDRRQLSGRQFKSGRPGGAIDNPIMHYRSTTFLLEILCITDLYNDTKLSRKTFFIFSQRRWTAASIFRFFLGENPEAHENQLSALLGSEFWQDAFSRIHHHCSLKNGTLIFFGTYIAFKIFMIMVYSIFNPMNLRRL